MEYGPQVDRPETYWKKGYLTEDRWANYWHQIAAIRAASPKSLLEIGKGNGIVGGVLRGLGVGVTTLDIDVRLHPDIVGSVTQVPCEDASYDMVLAAEILEHVRYEDFLVALREIHRVTRHGAYITLPAPGYTISFRIKVPLVRRVRFTLKIPFFWKPAPSVSEHYWEVGLKGYPMRRILRDIKSVGFVITERGLFDDDPAHYHFMLRKS